MESEEKPMEVEVTPQESHDQPENEGMEVDEVRLDEVSGNPSTVLPSSSQSTNSEPSSASELQAGTNTNTSELQAGTNTNTSELQAGTNTNTSELQAGTNTNTSELQAGTNTNTSELQAGTNTNTSELQAGTNTNTSEVGEAEGQSHSLPDSQHSSQPEPGDAATPPGEATDTVGGERNTQATAAPSEGSGDSQDYDGGWENISDSPARVETSTSDWGWGWGRSWSKRDTDDYRKGYPGKRSGTGRKNLEFYMNRLPCQPDGLLIEEIHASWPGDYRLMENKHGYIQWLFPIKERGLNWEAQELNDEEIKAICEDKLAHKRILTSYNMMLDFYGMELKSEETGEIVRAKNWKERFRHLNYSMHNYMRITRILKCLGEFGYEHLKPPFIRFVLWEAIVEGTLSRTLDSCRNYWIQVLRDDKEQTQIKDDYDYFKTHKKELRKKSCSRDMEERSEDADHTETKTKQKHYKPGYSLV